MNYASASTCLCGPRRDNPVGAERPANPPKAGGRGNSQPRVKVTDTVTEETVYVAEFYLDKPLKASTEPRRAERVGIGALVSAVWDDGPDRPAPGPHLRRPCTAGRRATGLGKRC